MIPHAEMLALFVDRLRENGAQVMDTTSGEDLAPMIRARLDGLVAQLDPHASSEVEVVSYAHRTNVWRIVVERVKDFGFVFGDLGGICGFTGPAPRLKKGTEATLANRPVSHYWLLRDEDVSHEEVDRVAKAILAIQGWIIERLKIATYMKESGLPWPPPAPEDQPGSGSQ